MGDFLNNEIERKTKVSNEILKNLFINYDPLQIKFFLMVLNKAVSSHWAKTNDNNRDEIINYDSTLIYLPLDFIKKYKGKKHLTKSEISDIMFSLHIVFKLRDNDGHIKTLSTVDEIIFENEKDRFLIALNENAMDYLVLISDNYSCLDLNLLKDLKGKYEIGIYIIYCMCKNLTKNKYFTIEHLKDFFNVKGSTNDLLKYIRKSLLTLEKKGLCIDISTQKRGTKIQTVLFKF